ncbi:hypothetical protein QQ045_029158 [Rhodiola kirilowii]
MGDAAVGHIVMKLYAGITPANRREISYRNCIRFTASSDGSSTHLHLITIQPRLRISGEEASGATLLVQGLSSRRVDEIVSGFYGAFGTTAELDAFQEQWVSLNMLKLTLKKVLQACVQAGKAAPFDTGGGDATGHSLVLGSRGERMKAKLMSELSPAELVIEDVSYQHAGVRGETHFNVKVVSGKFEGKNLVKRHRLIYELLQEELQSGLHALSIVAMMPSEVNR